jgi:hypothetical protein
MTRLIWRAFAQTINDMTLDNGYPDFTRCVDVRDIGGSAPGDIPWPDGFEFPDLDGGQTCIIMDPPLEIYRDENVTVSATLVDHHQVFPAFAFRFDTDDGSVVISGDTAKDTLGNLQVLADGADILVHEVIDPAWIEQKFGEDPDPPMDALKAHMYASHTTIEDVGTVASDCGVKTLVLNHIVPGNTPKAYLLKARRNFHGKLIIGEDLMQIGVGRVRKKSR